MDRSDAYLSDFSEVLLFIIGGVLFVVVALLTSRIIRPDRPNPEKLASYESGEDPVSAPWTQFNIRFYIIALVFLLFEVETIFLFPWSVIFANQELNDQTQGVWGWLTLFEMIFFIVILGLGLAYAWVNGHLDWIKPDPKPTEFESGIPKEFYNKINEQYRRK